MHRFYSPHADFSKSSITIADTHELHHLKTVLRMKSGDAVTLFDGSGHEATGTIEEISSRNARIRITARGTQKNETPQIILACALPKKGKFEFIIEKATELGVAEIIPLQTKRTEIVITEERRVQKKNDRFETVAINAAKQSQRTTIPVVHPIMPFTQALEQLLARQVGLLIPSLMGTRVPILTAFEKIGRPHALALFIGPEGDFTPNEYAEAHARGAIAVTLGKTILKVETAAISAVACAHLYYHTGTSNE